MASDNGNTGSATAPAARRAGASRRLARAALILDEAAAAIRPVTGAKVTLTVLGALLGAAICGWPAALGWLAGGLAIEVWGWFTSGPAARGEPVRWRQRALFAGSFAAVNLWWLGLALLMWRSGTPAGQACAAVIGCAIVALGVLLFYNVPVVFLAVGTVPAGSALSVILLHDGRPWTDTAAIWAALVLSLAFTAGRALATPSFQAQQRRLNESLQKYEVLAATVTDIIARTDMNGVHQYVSPACFAILGYRPDEMVGMARRDMLHPDSLPLIAPAYAQMHAEPDRPSVLTTQVRHKDGHWVWLQTNARLVFEQGVAVGVIDVSRDVTERVAVEAALNTAKAEAEAANRAKSEFLANVSHEIRTPMNGVLGAMHLLESENISAEGRELLRHAADSGRMLSQLLNDVLDLSKIEAGQLDLSPEAMHLGEALNSVAALLAGQAHAKGVAFSCEVDVSGGDEGLWVLADPVRVRQAIFNLIGNAVKFTDHGHVAVRLSVAAAGADRLRVSLEVKDSGIGMTAEAQAHLFERFRQAQSDTTRRYGGTGLGLSITQALARMMKGEITFSSVLGRGSTFCLAFEAPRAAPARVEVVEDGLLSGVSVLVVDDNATNRLVARTLLTRLGAAVVEADDGVAAVREARLGLHDLILMDIQMPIMNGIEATRAIRGLGGAAADVPILGLTANVMAHQTDEYLAAGMDGVVAKPISPGALLAAIARVTADPAPARAAG